MANPVPSPSTEVLTPLREQLDAVDVTLIETLARRFQICREVALLKKKHGIPMMQHGRVEYVKQRCAEMGAARGLNAELVLRLYELIIDHACQVESTIISEGGDEQKR